MGDSGGTRIWGFKERGGTFFVRPPAAAASRRRCPGHKRAFWGRGHDLTMSASTAATKAAAAAAAAARLFGIAGGCGQQRSGRCSQTFYAPRRAQVRSSRCARYERQASWDGEPCRACDQQTRAGTVSCVHHTARPRVHCFLRDAHNHPVPVPTATGSCACDCSCVCTRRAQKCGVGHARRVSCAPVVVTVAVCAMPAACRAHHLRSAGKVAVVTGGGRGIGEMIARTYVEAGAKVRAGPPSPLFIQARALRCTIPHHVHAHVHAHARARRYTSQAGLPMHAQQRPPH